MLQEFFSKLLTFALSVLNSVLFTICLFTTLFDFFKSIVTVVSLSKSKSFTFTYKFFKLVGTLTNSAMSNFLTSAFKRIRSFLAAKSDVSTSVTWSNYF